MVITHFKGIRDAIEYEEEAYQLYKKLKSLLVDKNSIKICDELMLSELRHKEMLQGLGSQDIKFVQEKCEKLGGYNLNAIYALEPPIKNEQIKDILQFALEKEARSVKRYKELFNSSANDSSKIFFEKMIEEEKKHVQMVSIELEKYRDLENKKFIT